MFINLLMPGNHQASILSFFLREGDPSSERYNNFTHVSEALKPLSCSEAVGSVPCFRSRWKMPGPWLM